ncbi:MAG: adenylate/guanylate cyclase domain-containing protein [Pseudomonadota bacterium]|nr:adenylate/guanylate cyclase domain-containing protein [Pseudomonadota bacterium]
MSQTIQPPPRRLTAVLYTDVVGFSRLTHEDENATYQAIRRYQSTQKQIVNQHGGRVVDTAGDSTLAVFPVAADSIQAAIDIQVYLTGENACLPEDRHIKIRIGINLGDIIDDGNSVFGDGVNVAARLQALAPAGGICVSGSARSVVGDSLEIHFQPIGEQILHNIETPVMAYLVLAGDQPIERNIPHAEDPRLSIAVLPFNNLDSDSSSDSLGDGLTIDLITALSRFRQLFVLAQHTALAHTGTTHDKVSTGRRLGARYLVDGSIRKRGRSFRVVVQLIETRSGGYLWSENYDGNTDGLFAIQDTITRRIVTTLISTIEQSAIRSAPTQQRHADYADVARANQLVYRMREPADTEKARELFEKVLASDAAFVPALSGLALTHLTDFLMFWTDDPATAVPRAAQYAQKALEFDQSDSLAHAVFGITSLWSRQYVEAITHLDQAIELNPNHADALAGKGLTLNFIGDPEAGIRQLTEALERNPFPPSWYLWSLAIAQYNTGRYAPAVQTLLKISQPNRFQRRWLAGAYARTGDLENAKIQRDIVMSEVPNYRVSDSFNQQPYQNPKDIQPFIDGLLLAGFNR